MPRVYARRFDWDEARRLRDQGLSYVAIARLLGVSHNAVGRAVNPTVRAKSDQRVAAWGSALTETCADCGAPISRASAFSQHRRNPHKPLRCRPCGYRAAAQDRTTTVRPDTLRCTYCHQWLPDADYGPQRGNQARRGRSGGCRRCEAAVKRLHRAARRAAGRPAA